MCHDIVRAFLLQVLIGKQLLLPIGNAILKSFKLLFSHFQIPFSVLRLMPTMELDFDQGINRQREVVGSDDT
jgi:hypothetical protein